MLRSMLCSSSVEQEWWTRGWDILAEDAGEQGVVGTGRGSVRRRRTHSHLGRPARGPAELEVGEGTRVRSQGHRWGERMPECTTTEECTATEEWARDCLGGREGV